MSANSKPPFAGEVRRVRLGDVCDVEKAGGSSDEKVWLLNLDAVEKNTGHVTRRETVPRSSLGLSVVPFTAESVLYSKLRPNLNKVVLPDSNGYATSEMIPLKPHASVLAREYLASYLRSEGFVRYAAESTAGAKMPRVSRRVVLDAEIPLLPLEEQNAAASCFGIINLLVMGCQRQLGLLDNLVKSRFVEMFGDGAGFRWCPMSELVSGIVSGSNVGGVQRPLRDGEYAVLKISAVTKGTFRPDEYKVVDAGALPPHMIHPRKGDLLFSRANTSEMVGATAIVDGDYDRLFLPDKLWRLDLASDVDTVFLRYLLSSPRARATMSKISTGTSGSMQNISMAKFRSLVAFKPPLDLQREFAAFADAVDKSQVAVKRQIEKLQTLYDSLSQEYFG